MTLKQRINCGGSLCSKSEDSQGPSLECSLHEAGARKDNIQFSSCGAVEAGGVKRLGGKMKGNVVTLLKFLRS